MEGVNGDLSAGLDFGVIHRKLDSLLVACTLLFIATAFLLPNSAHLNPIGNQESSASSSIEWEVLNVDGDLSLASKEDRKCWSFHKVGFTEATSWSVSFSDKALIRLETVHGESGHIAVGMWWTSGFKSGEKAQLRSSGFSRILVDFDVKLSVAQMLEGDEWLRVGLACAIQRDDGSVVYTEMDFWDSPHTLKHPSGDIQLGGDTVYQGEDVAEFKIDQVPLGVWKHIRIDLTSYADRAWQIGAGDRLESVYIVIECDNNPVRVEMEVDNLWIQRSSPSHIS